MSELFSDEWETSFQRAWNADVGIAAELEEIGFNSITGCSFEGDEEPLGGIGVDNGRAFSAGSFNGEVTNWDLQADKLTWEKRIAKQPGILVLGIAYTSKKPQFLVGDIDATMKDPRASCLFTNNIAAMGKA